MAFRVAQHLVQLWIHILRQEVFGRIPGFLRVWVEAAHVDHGSGLFSTGFAGIYAPRAVFPTFALSQNGEVCTVDASAAEQFSPRKPGHYFYEPRVLQYFQLSADSAR